MKMKIFFVCVFAYFLCIGAQAWAGFSISPMRFELNVEAGNTGTALLNISNNDESPVSVTLSTTDFTVDPIGQDVALPPGTSARGCAEWLTISPMNIELGPNDRVEARVTLTVPDDAKGSYGALIFAEQSSKPMPVITTQGGHSVQINVKPRWLIRLHEHVPGTAVNNGQITDMNASPQDAENPVRVSVEFENTGNSLLHCAGRVEIRDEEGNEIEVILIGSQGRFTVYPDGKRLLSGNSSKPLAPGTYIALAVIDYGEDELVAGEMEFEVK